MPRMRRWQPAAVQVTLNTVRLAELGVPKLDGIYSKNWSVLGLSIHSKREVLARKQIKHSVQEICPVEAEPTL
jgi:hypothetical protein